MSIPKGVEGEGEIEGMEHDPNYTAYYLNKYGAHFAEVGVDVDTAEIRLRRMLGVFSRRAHSESQNGALADDRRHDPGVSYALLEEAVVDTRTGAFVNRDLAEYLVPVHADIPDIDAVLLDGFDDKANVLGAKGIGELGVCGSAAAVTNAVFNAVGFRVRNFPITLNKVLGGWPPNGPFPALRSDSHRHDSVTIDGSVQTASILSAVGWAPELSMLAAPGLPRFGCGRSGRANSSVHDDR